jgi:hypothetical protein
MHGRTRGRHWHEPQRNDWMARWPTCQARIWFAGHGARGSGPDEPQQEAIAAYQARGGPGRVPRDVPGGLGDCYRLSQSVAAVAANVGSHRPVPCLRVQGGPQANSLGRSELT